MAQTATDSWSPLAFPCGQKAPADWAEAVAIGPGHQIVAAGHSYNGWEFKFAVARYLGGM
jgi:hypothetical protein